MSPKSNIARVCEFFPQKSFIPNCFFGRREIALKIFEEIKQMPEGHSLDYEGTAVSAAQQAG